LFFLFLLVLPVLLAFLTRAAVSLPCILAQQDAFEAVINKRQNKPAELLARFMDGKLRSGYKVRLCPCSFFTVCVICLLVCSLNWIFFSVRFFFFLPSRYCHCPSQQRQKCSPFPQEHTEEELDSLLDQCLVLFRFLNGMRPYQ
jgi:hypothetical protein